MKHLSFMPQKHAPEAVLDQQTIALMQEQLRSLKSLQYWHNASCRWGAALSLTAGCSPWVADVNAQLPVLVAYGLLSALLLGIAVCLWWGSVDVKNVYQPSIDSLQHRVDLAIENQLYLNMLSKENVN